MVNQQLLDYVRQQISAGTPKADIQKALQAQGWNVQDIGEAFTALNPAPAPVPVPPPVQPVQPTPPVTPVAPVMPPMQQPAPVQPPAQPIVSQPASVVVQPAVTILPNRTAPMVSQPPTRSSRHILFPVIVVSVLLFLCGGIAYAYTTGKLALLESYIPFLSSAPYDKTQVLSGVVKGIGDIQTSSWGVDVHVQAQNRDAGVEPLPASTKSQDPTVAGLLGFVPADFNATLHLDGATQNTQNGIDGKGAISFDLTSADLTLSLAAELRKVGDNIYVVVTKIPGLFGSDLSALRGKWVLLTPQDIKNSGGGFSLDFASPKNQDAQKQQALADLQKLIQIESADNVLVSATPVRDTLDAQSMYRYDLSLDAAALPGFYSDVLNAFSGEASSTVHFSKDVNTYLHSDDGKAFADYLSKNITVRIWVDSKGIPHKFEVSLRVVPGDDVKKLAGKQISVVGDLTLKDINKAVVIDVPSPTMSFDDAYSLATGQTMQALSEARQKARDAQRVASLQEMARAIAIADTDPAPTIAGCTGSHTNVINCVGPVPINFKNFTDSGAGVSGQMCTPASNSPCQYSISRSNGLSGATTQNYEICSYLEVGVGTVSKGLVSVNSASGARVVRGCR